MFWLPQCTQNEEKQYTLWVGYNIILIGEESLGLIPYNMLDQATICVRQLVFFVHYADCLGWSGKYAPDRTENINGSMCVIVKLEA